MAHEVIYSSPNVKITKGDDGFYIEGIKTGMLVGEFNEIIAAHSEIKITSFMTIKNALMFPPKSATKFGETKDKISVEISGDKLRAYLLFSVSEDELKIEKRGQLINDAKAKLKERGVVFGIKEDVFVGDLVNGKQIMIAEGTAHQNGEDSFFNIKTSKEPTVTVIEKEDVDYDEYSVDLFELVKEGSKLGSRTLPKDGKDGTSVTGVKIKAKKGSLYPINYDKGYISELEEGEKTFLITKKEGVIDYKGDKITIANHKEGLENLDENFGNMEYDGFLTVKGSVKNALSIVTSRDVQFLNKEPIYAIKEIISKNGSVYAKNGVIGAGKTVIKAKKDVYLKFVRDATIECEGKVHIGFYCLNTIIKAKEVIIDSSNGQIIGGNIRAEIRIVAPIIGSRSQKETLIVILGFERAKIKEKLKKITISIEKLRMDMLKHRSQCCNLTDIKDLNREQRSIMEESKMRYFDIRDELREIDERRKALVSRMRSQGEGEVRVLIKVYPNVEFEFRKEEFVKLIDELYNSAIFYMESGELKAIQ